MRRIQSEKKRKKKCTCYIYMWFNSFYLRRHRGVRRRQSASNPIPAIFSFFFKKISIFFAQAQRGGGGRARVTLSLPYFFFWIFFNLFLRRHRGVEEEEREQPYPCHIFFLNFFLHFCPYSFNLFIYLFFPYIFLRTRRERRSRQSADASLPSDFF